MTSGQRQSIKPPRAFLFLGLRSKGALFSLCLLLTAWVQAAPLQGEKDGWFKLIGPDASKSQKFMLNKQGGSQLPEVKNITVVDKK